MSQYYVPETLEVNIKWHIPFTPYFLYRDPVMKLWYLVEKELCKHIYRYRFL